MKRLHVHVGVDDLDRSIRFYSTLFAVEPTVVKDDYANWMLDVPRVNFAISAGRLAAKGIQHLGVQVESREELSEVHGRLKAADRPVLEEGQTTCCSIGGVFSARQDACGCMAAVGCPCLAHSKTA